MRKLYKVLKPGLISPYKGFKYKLGKEYVSDDFDKNTSEDCSNGFYAVDWDGLSYAYRKGLSVYEVEVSGREVEYNKFKRRYEKQKIIRKLTIGEIKDGLLSASKEAGYNLLLTSFPKNPLYGKPKKVTKKHIELLKKVASVWDSVGDSIWASVWDSVRASVGDSVWASVRASVGDSVLDSVLDSVGDSIWDSVGDSIWDSVLAYTSSFFPNVKKWNYIDHEEGANPFQPYIDLWNSGFVPSFDGEVWRLHSGKDAEIVYEIEEDLLND